MALLPPPFACTLCAPRAEAGAERGVLRSGDEPSPRCGGDAVIGARCSACWPRCCGGVRGALP